MNTLKLLRRLHLWMGCFFSPLLLFFVITGWYQTLRTDRRKGFAEADDWISRLTSVHVDQVYPAAWANKFSPGLFRVLVVVMCVALIATLVIGVALALQTIRPRWPVWVSLVLGMLVPILFLWLGMSR